MKSRKMICMLLCAMLLASCLGGASAEQTEEGTAFARGFVNPMETDSMLKVRYWLPSGYPASSEKNLAEIDRELKELADAGYSTVEVANVYEGLTAPEYEALAAGDGHESYLFGSSYWKETLRQILKSAKAYGITVDVTMGPHWPAASDIIDIDDDATMKEAVYAVTELKAGETYEGLTHNYAAITQSAAEPHLLGVYAARYVSTQECSKSVGFGPNATTVTWLQYALVDDTMEKLESAGEDSYTFTAPEDNYLVIEIYSHSTGATINYNTYNNPDTNYTGYCLDMYNDAGANHFFDYFAEYCVDDEIVELLKEVGGNFFEDNFSYSAQNIWTSTLPETFLEKNGYDMMDVLPYTLGISANGHSSERNNTGIDLVTTAPFVIADDVDYTYNRIRGDMIKAWASCYLEQHIATVMARASEYGMGFRTQTYGGNIDTGLCAATVTRPEGESIGFSDRFDGYSMLAAGRDMGGDTPVLSTEFAASFAAGGAYGYAWDDLMKTAYQVYSAGVNSLVFHGYSYMYSPESVWPGNHAFGFACSGTWSSRDPQWNHIDQLSASLRRVQYALQQGVQKTDVAVYESLGNAQGGGPFYDGSALTAKGYSYQLFTPGLLSMDSAVVTNGRLNEAGPAYQALVLDDETAMSRENMEKLIGFADAGLKLVFANGLPCISTSITEDNAEIAALMDQLLESENVVAVESSDQIGDALAQLGVVPAAAKAEPDTSFLTVHRVMDGGDIYFIYNSTDDEAVADFAFAGEGAPFLLDNWTGEIKPVAAYTEADGTVRVTVALSGRDAILLGIGEAFGEAPETHAEDGSDETFGQSGALIVREADAPIAIDDWDLKVESWTSGDPEDAAVTAKDLVFEDHVDAVSWTAIEGLGDGISGIGTYTAAFTLDDVTDLGAILSFTEVGETFKVTLNGVELPAANQVTESIDLAGYLKAGENVLTVEVATSLQNAANAVRGEAGNKEYGIIGTTTITPYREVAVNP